MLLLVDLILKKNENICLHSADGIIYMSVIMTTETTKMSAHASYLCYVPGEYLRVHSGGHEDDLKVFGANRIPQRDQKKVTELISLVNLVYEHVRHP